MDRRLELHHKLRSLYERVTNKSSEGKVYFQPPANVRLSYPCLIYKLTDMPTNHANNFPYKIEHCYELSVIDSDPNSKLREQVARMFTCRMVRSYESDNLHHYVFHIYD